jgi:hypothetical protein
MRLPRVESRLAESETRLDLLDSAGMSHSARAPQGIDGCDWVYDGVLGSGGRPEYRRRTRISVAATVVSARPVQPLLDLQWDDREDVRSRAGNAGNSHDFEKRPAHITDQRGGLGERAAQGEKGVIDLPIVSELRAVPCQVVARASGVAAGAAVVVR